MALKYRTKSKEQSSKPLLEVPLDTTGRLANAYVDIMEKIKALQEELVTAGLELIDALKVQGRKGITVRGITLKIKEIEAKIKITAQKSKD